MLLARLINVNEGPSLYFHPDFTWLKPVYMITNKMISSYHINSLTT